MAHAHAVVWIDHREAKVFHFGLDDVQQDQVKPHHPTQHLHHKANSIGSGHAPQDQKYLQDVVDAIGEAGAILIVGPANEKTELLKHIEKHVPAMKAKIAGVEAMDHPTDNQIVAFARHFFKADHMEKPRIS